MTLALFPQALVPVRLSTDAQNTPRDLALDLGRFDLDVASNPLSNILADRSLCLENGDDGLSAHWTLDGSTSSRLASVWCNGPYSDPLPWCERLRAHSAPWAALWKLDTTTRWFAEALGVGPKGERAQWAPFRARLAFERDGNVGSADFASVLIWRDWTVPGAVARRLWMPSERAGSRRTRNRIAPVNPLHAKQPAKGEGDGT